MTHKAVALIPVAILVLVVTLMVIGVYLWPDSDEVAPRVTENPALPTEPDTGLSAGTVKRGAVAPSTPKEVAAILGQTTDKAEHLMRVEALPAQLSKEQVDALRWLLRDSSQDEALKNIVANRLRARRDTHLVEYLTEMLWDENETPKWRNYCVQQLRACYEEDPNPAILDTLFKAAEADEKMVRTCAVWSLARLATPVDKSQMPSEETLAKIRSLALEALQEKDAHFLITEAGVQSCARLGLKESLPGIRALAGDDGTEPVHLRIVAVAALGELKDMQSAPLFERLSKEATGQLQSAAQLALKRINAAGQAQEIAPHFSR